MISRLSSPVVPSAAEQPTEIAIGQIIRGGCSKLLFQRDDTDGKSSDKDASTKSEEHLAILALLQERHAAISPRLVSTFHFRKLAYVYSRIGAWLAIQRICLAVTPMS